MATSRQHLAWQRLAVGLFITFVGILLFARHHTRSNEATVMRFAREWHSDDEGAAALVEKALVQEQEQTRAQHDDVTKPGQGSLSQRLRQQWLDRHQAREVTDTEDINHASESQQRQPKPKLELAPNAVENAKKSFAKLSRRNDGQKRAEEPRAEGSPQKGGVAASIANEDPTNRERHVKEVDDVVERQAQSRERVCVVLVGIGRSGSTKLSQELQELPGAFGILEPFKIPADNPGTPAGFTYSDLFSCRAYTSHTNTVLWSYACQNNRRLKEKGVCTMDVARKGAIAQQECLESSDIVLIKTLRFHLFHDLRADAGTSGCTSLKIAHNLRHPWHVALSAFGLGWIVGKDKLGSEAGIMDALYDTTVHRCTRVLEQVAIFARVRDDEGLPSLELVHTEDRSDTTAAEMLKAFVLEGQPASDPRHEMDIARPDTHFARSRKPGDVFLAKLSAEQIAETQERAMNHPDCVRVLALYNERLAARTRQGREHLSSL